MKQNNPQVLSYRCTYVPGGHSNPVSLKRNVPLKLGHLLVCVQVLSGFATIFYGFHGVPRVRGKLLLPEVKDTLRIGLRSTTDTTMFYLGS